MKAPVWRPSTDTIAATHASVRISHATGATMLTPEACRAGRAILRWTMQELARESGVAWTTVANMEAGKSVRSSTRMRIKVAFRKRGVDVLSDGERSGAVLVYARSDSPCYAGQCIPTPGGS